jgi:hypothetical protein
MQASTIPRPILSTNLLEFGSFKKICTNIPKFRDLYGRVFSLSLPPSASFELRVVWAIRRPWKQTDMGAPDLKKIQETSMEEILGFQVFSELLGKD